MKMLEDAHFHRGGSSFGKGSRGSICVFTDVYGLWQPSRSCVQVLSIFSTQLLSETAPRDVQIDAFHPVFGAKSLEICRF